MDEEKKVEPVRPASAGEWALWDAAAVALVLSGRSTEYAARLADALLIERRRRGVVTEASPAGVAPSVGQVRAGDP